MRATVANFSFPKALVLIGVFLPLIIGCLGLTVYAPSHNLVGRMHFSYLVFVFLMIWGCGLPCLLFIVALVRQLIFFHLQAVWLERGNLIYLDRHYFSVPCAKIREASIGMTGRYNAVAVALRLIDGEEKKIPVRFLSASADHIVAKLHELIPELKS